jgi:hypothetical protein
LELQRLVKKSMENKCWKKTKMEHTHLERWARASGKMGDPVTQMKFSLSNCTWLEKIEYGLVFKALIFK